MLHWQLLMARSVKHPAVNLVKGRPSKHRQNLQNSYLITRNSPLWMNHSVPLKTYMPALCSTIVNDVPNTISCYIEAQYDETGLGHKHSFHFFSFWSISRTDANWDTRIRWHVTVILMKGTFQWQAIYTRTKLNLISEMHQVLITCLMFHAANQIATCTRHTQSWF